MAKRKSKHIRQTGLQKGNLCPHCGSLVREVSHLVKPEGEYIVHHWWKLTPCYSSERIKEYLTMRARDVSDDKRRVK